MWELPENTPLRLIPSSKNEVPYSFELWVKVFIDNKRSKIWLQISDLLSDDRLYETRQIIEDWFNNDANY
jgi:hypothetical protein